MQVLEQIDKVKRQMEQRARDFTSLVRGAFLGYASVEPSIQVQVTNDADSSMDGHMHEGLQMTGEPTACNRGLEEKDHGADDLAGRFEGGVSRGSGATEQWGARGGDVLARDRSGSGACAGCDSGAELRVGQLPGDDVFRDSIVFCQEVHDQAVFRLIVAVSQGFIIRSSPMSFRGRAYVIFC